MNNNEDFSESNVSLAFHFFSLRVLLPYGIISNIWSLFSEINYFQFHPMIKLECILLILEIGLAVATLIGLKRSKAYAFYTVLIYFWSTAFLNISSATFMATSIQGFALDVNVRTYIFRAIIIWGIAIAVTQYYLGRKFIFVKKKEKLERVVYYNAPEVRLSARETEDLVSKRLGSLVGNPSDDNTVTAASAKETIKEASPWD